MKHLSNEFMLDMLAKIQPLQAEALKRDKAFHIDASVHDDIGDYGSTHICIDVTIFDSNSIIGSFYFNATDTAEEVDAQFAALLAFHNTL